MKKFYMALLSGGILLSGCSDKTPKLGKDSIDEVIKAMTLEEKVHLLIGTGMAGMDGNDGAAVGKTENLVPGAAGTTYAIPRLGIPSIVLADGPAGLRINPTREGDENTYYATHFPIGTLLASTWDTELVEQVGEAIGNEVLEYGVDVLLAPGMNIQRNPLNGRNFEYYSEDPLVSGEIAAAYVRGVQKNNVGTSVKHFVANNQETNRTATDAIVSPRALREIYLKGFEIALKESDPWTLMTSYNLLNGVYTSENPELLTTLLRDEWKYEGTVMTDWFGGKDAPAQVRAGNDMIQPGYQKQYDDIIAAVKDGTLDEKDIDRNVKRILELIVKTPRFKGYKFSNSPDLKAHAEITKKSAEEGMVLLKNDNKVLPLSSSIKKIALFGNTSYDFIPGGTGSGNVNSKYTVSLLEGLENVGLDVNKDLANEYHSYLTQAKALIKQEQEKDSKAGWFTPPLPEEMAVSIDKIKELVNSNDAAIITIGRNSGEFADRKSADFYLSEKEQSLIKNVSNIFEVAGKPVIVILNIGGAIETASWKSEPDAILLAWQGGQEGGNSVADLLIGNANPSGKLAMTFPLKVTDPYSSINFPIDKDANVEAFLDFDRKRGNERNVDYTEYEEDVYVGYRYFTSFNVPVSYPFGYGLSYTTFSYDNPEISLKDGKYEIMVKVTNSGETEGKEVVQTYVTAPDTKIQNQPDLVLKAFAKTKLLKPGESQVLKMDIPVSDLAFFNETNSSWDITGGKYIFKIGASSADIKGEVAVEVSPSSNKVADILTPETSINILKH